MLKLYGIAAVKWLVKLILDHLRVLLGRSRHVCKLQEERMHLQGPSHQHLLRSQGNRGLLGEQNVDCLDRDFYLIY